MSKSKSPTEWLDSAIDELYTLKSGGREKFKQAILNHVEELVEKEALKARIEELTHVQLEHGNYVTQTWFRLKAYTIKERIEQLTKQLGSK